jgi:hypothetical protein
MDCFLSLGMERPSAASDTTPYLQESDGKRCLFDYVCQWLEFRCSGIISPRVLSGLVAAHTNMRLTV